jgi:hypothetical protein
MGVVEFNARATLRSNDSDQGLLAATIVGPNSLGLTNGPEPGTLASPSQAFQRLLWEVQNKALTTVKFAVAAAFNAAGEAEDWAPKRMKRQAKGFWKYQRLTRSQFLATGSAALTANARNVIQNLELHFYELTTS